MIKTIKNNINFFRSALFGLFSILFSVFITFYITPFIISSVGIDAYGFVSLSNNIISYMEIITIALNAYAARYISIAYIKKRYNEFNTYFNTVFWGDVGVGTAILAVFLLFIVFINKILNIPPRLVTDVQILFLFVSVNYFLSLISVSWKVFAQIKDRIDIINFLESLSYILQIIVLYITFNLFEPHIWYVSIARTIATAMILGPCVSETIQYIPELKINLKKFSKKHANILILKGLWNSIDGLGNTLNSGLDLLITDLMLSATDMGKVSVAKSIIALITRLYTMIAQIFNPKFIKAYAEDNSRLLIRYYKQAIIICGLITNVIVTCFFFLGIDFISLWLPDQDVNTIYWLSVISIIPCIIEGMTYPLYSVYTLTTKIKVTTCITIFSGILNVISMMLLLKYTTLGPYAIVLTTAVIVTIGHLVTPFYSCHCLKINIFSFIPTMLWISCELLINTLVIYFLNQLLWAGSSWRRLIWKASIIGIISMGIAAIFFYISKSHLQNRLEKFQVRGK